MLLTGLCRIKSINKKHNESSLITCSFGYRLKRPEEFYKNSVRKNADIFPYAVFYYKGAEQGL